MITIKYQLTTNSDSSARNMGQWAWASLSKAFAFFFFGKSKAFALMPLIIDTNLKKSYLFSLKL